MFPRLALLFILLPILELAVLVKLGQLVGFWPTLALVLGTGFIGAHLARSAGTKLLAHVRSEMGAGRVPSEALLDGLAILVGGILLLTPGIITDVAGIALLFGPTRRWIQARARRWFEAQVETGRVNVGMLSSDGVIIRTSTSRRPAGSGGTPRGLDPRNEIEQRRPEE
jgi:UPF0716 protein FxsA